jgi:hypothetical protein
VRWSGEELDVKEKEYLWGKRMVEACDRRMGTEKERKGKEKKKKCGEVSRPAGLYRVYPGADLRREAWGGKGRRKVWRGCVRRICAAIEGKAFGEILGSFFPP